MHISPINNNTNFKGGFIKTPALEKALKKADVNSLGRFNDIINRAAMVNDGLQFKIVEQANTYPRKTYSLYKLDRVKNVSSIVRSVTTKLNNVFGTGVQESEILAKFIPALEEYYPKNYEESKNVLLNKINEELI